MAKRITPGQIRRTNRQQVFQYIYDEKKVSQQDIAYALQLSRPTVAAALTEMEEMGMILKSGYLDSDQIGRKAAAYSIDETFRVAVGVEIMRSRVKFVAADLYGRMLGREIWDFPYANEQAYFSQVSEKILAFIHNLSLPDEKILGIGIAIQGLVNADGSEVVYGTILDCTGLKIEVFTRHLPFPCAFVHDPDAAAIGREAVRRAETYLGRPYDYAFATGMETVYCSELVWTCFLRKDGSHVFRSVPMTFKGPDGETDPYWVAHYEQLGAPIPEGEPGTNPNDLFREPVLRDVAVF